MTKPTITLHNAETNEIIERDMTAVEIKQFNDDVAMGEALQAQAEQKASARQAILDRLGITAEEAALLLGQ